MKGFNKIIQIKEINSISKENWKRIYNLYEKIIGKSIFHSIQENIEKKYEESDNFEKEFIEIEINAIVKELTKKTYKKIIKTNGYTIYYYEKNIDIFISDKDEIENLYEEIIKMMEEGKAVIYIDKNKDDHPEKIEGNAEESAKKIIEIIKSEEYKEKKSKIRIKSK